MNETERIKFCLDWIQKIKDEQILINEDRAKALQFYRGDPAIVNYIAGRSSATTTDMMDAVEWAKPSLLDVFASGNEVCSIQPVTEEDVKPAEDQNILVNHQLKVKNKWFMVLHDWFDDALKLRMGAIKYQWFKDVQLIEKEYTDLTEDEYKAILQKPNTFLVSQTENVIQEEQFDPITRKGTPRVLTFDIVVNHKIEDEYPLIEAIPAEEVGFLLKSTRDIATTPFLYHRTTYKKDDFIERYGKEAYNNVSVSVDMQDQDRVTRERFAELGGISHVCDEVKSEFYVYECYYKENTKPVITELCGDTILDHIPNKYGKPPFHALTPVKMAHKVSGFSFYDLLKEIQKIRTALMRQILDNVYFANNRRYFLDPQKVNVDDFLNNNFTGAVIRTKGDPNNVVRPEDKAPLPPEVFAFWEMLNTEKDYHSGVPRSFQGVNPKALNETWRGGQAQINQAAQRIAMMARLFAEMGIAPLVYDIVGLNMKFLKKKTAVRYLNSFRPIEPDNIIGKFDIVVNVGLGASNKDQVIMYTQQLLGLYAQLFKANLGIVTSDNAYNAMKELIKAMGFKNTGDFITDPGFVEATRALVMLILQSGFAQQYPELMQMITKVAQGIGLPPEMVQAISAQTFQGQETPQQPKVPQQPMQAQIRGQGGGYFG